MSLRNVITVGGGTVLTVAPQLVTAVPAPYRDLASAIAAIITAIFHLYETPPNQPTPSPVVIVKP